MATTRSATCRREASSCGRHGSGLRRGSKSSPSAPAVRPRRRSKCRRRRPCSRPSSSPATGRVGVKTNVSQLIQGRAAGVEVIQNNGEPGAGAQILIRGGSSVSAKNDPLYVIDGVPINNVATEPDANGWTGNPSLARNPLNMLNPGDISSITVLKDAASTAIYGSRASNGVILIETKRGQASGGATFEYDGYVSTSSPSRNLDVLTGSEYAAFVRTQVAAGKLDSARLGDLGVLWKTGPNPGDTVRTIYNTNWESALT